jgi:uncharacterized repeat protein (TIGR01451 family)
LSKDDGGITAAPGDTVTYLLSYANTGNRGATGVVITDTVPLYTTFDAGSSDPLWTCADVTPGSACTLDVGLLSAGASDTVAFAVTVDHPIPTGIVSITNTAGIYDDGTNGLDLPTNNVGTDSTPIIATPDLVLTKDDGTPTARPGDTLIYSLIITNAGDQAATGIAVTDTLPLHTTFVAASDGGSETAPGSGVVTWPAFTLAGDDASVLRTVTVSVDTPLPAGVTAITNTAEVREDGANGPEPRGNNRDDDIDAIIAAPDLVIAKSDGTPTAQPGDTLTYTLVVTNVGDQEATGVDLTDTLPEYTAFVAASDGGSETAPGSGIVTWPAFNLAGGSTPAIRTVTVVVDDPLPAVVTAITNTADVTEDRGDTASAQDRDVIDAAPALTLHKTDGVATARPGDTLVYALTVTNTGNWEATGVLITDTLPTHTTFAAASDGGSETAPGSGIVTWPAFNLPGGDTPALRLVTATVNTPLPTGVVAITNTASVTDQSGNHAGAEDSDAIEATPDLALAKADDDFVAQPGATIVYTLTLANTGDQAATGVVITDTVPDYTTFDAGASDPGWSCTGGEPAGTLCTFDVGALGGGISTTVTFAAAVIDPVPTGITQTLNRAATADDGANSAAPVTATATEVTPIEAVPELVLDKDDGGITAAPGDGVTYTLTYTNTGDQDATGVVLTDTVPAHATFDAGASDPGWSCTGGEPAGTACTFAIGALAADTGGTVAFAVTVIDPVPSGITQTLNLAEIADDGANSATPVRATASDTTPIVAAPDLALTKGDGGITASPGDVVVYTLAYSNTGNQDASGVVLTETVPAHTIYEVANNAFAWECAGTTGGSLCTHNLYDLNAGASGTVTYAVTVIDPIPAGVTQTLNLAEIADDGSNSAAPVRDTASDVTPLIGEPVLVLDKNDGGVDAQPGTTVVYTLTYSNQGVQDATGVVITDTVPTYTTFNAGASPPGWSCTATTCTYAVGTLPAATGVSDTVAFAVTVDPAVPANVTEIANLAEIADDGNNSASPIRDTASDTTPIVATPDLTLSKDDGGVTASPGDVVIYTLTYTNTGDQAATGTVITDTVPVNTTFNAGASTTGWSCTGGEPAGTLCTHEVGTVDAGTTGIETFAVTVNPAPFPAGEHIITNTATIGDDGANGFEDPVNNDALDTTPIDAAPDLTLSKDDGISAAAPGDGVIYTLDYANAGDQNATGVVLTETVPLHTTFDAGASSSGWSCTGGEPAGTLCTYAIGPLPMNGTGSVDFAVTLVNPVPAGVVETTNTAGIYDDGTGNPERAPADNRAAHVTPIEATPNLVLTKDDGDAIAYSGATVVYTLTYSNIGDQHATGVVLTETVPAYTTFDAFASSPAWSCLDDAPAGTLCTHPLGHVGAGGSVHFAVTLVDQVPINATRIFNEAVIGDDGNNSASPIQDTATLTTPISAAPDLTLSKDDGLPSAGPGETVVYALTYQNQGNRVANGVVITDRVPAHTTYNAAASDSGWTDCADGAPAGSVCSYDLGTVTGGGTVNFAVTVNATVPAGVAALHNHAGIRDDGADPNLADNTASDTTPLDAVPDLRIAKQNGTDVVLPGHVVTYTIIVENVGAQGATGVRITDTLGAGMDFVIASDDGREMPPGSNLIVWGTRDAIAIPANGRVERQIRVVTDENFPHTQDVVTNTVVVGDDRSNGPDANPNDNITWDVDTIGGIAPDLVIAKEDGNAVILPGELFTYTLSVQNMGNHGASGVIITDTLPTAQVTFHSASGGGVETAPGSGIIVWNVGTLGFGERKTRRLTVRVRDNVEEGAYITNIASTLDDGTNGPDPDLENNTTQLVSYVGWRKIHLPLMVLVPEQKPDLIVEDVNVASGGAYVEVSIKNVGLTDVTAPRGFWVDLYINPRRVPTMTNVTWDKVCDYGAAWGIVEPAIPIPPGETRVLHTNGQYYWPEESNMPPEGIAPGTKLCVQVDSVDDPLAPEKEGAGSVLEIHEVEPFKSNPKYYNNIICFTWSGASTVPPARPIAPPNPPDLPRNLPPRPR